MLAGLQEKVGRRIARAVVTRSHPLVLDRPTVTFTFDDIPVSAAISGAAILEGHGALGTFFVCGALAGQAWDLYRLAGFDLIGRLAAHGHEIGCHTASHGRLGQVSRRDLLDDIDRNATVLAAALGGKALTTFAYPYGIVRLDLKLAVQGRFRACRGIHDGLNRNRVDLGRVRADPLESRKLDEACVDRLLDETVRQGGWRVFYAHDVADAPTPFGVTPHLLGYAVSGAIRRGCAIRTLVETLDVIGAP